MSIATLLRTNTEHLSGIAASSRDRRDNLSDLECSCGLHFVAGLMSHIPRDAPGMLGVHKAEMTLLALGLPTGVVIEDLQEAGQPPAGAIIKSADGGLLQWDPGYGSDGHFRSPSGEHFALSEVACPVTVLWSPSGA